MKHENPDRISEMIIFGPMAVLLIIGSTVLGPFEARETQEYMQWVRCWKEADQRARGWDADAWAKQCNLRVAGTEDARVPIVETFEQICARVVKEIGEPMRLLLPVSLDEQIRCVTAPTGYRR